MPWEMTSVSELRLALCLAVRSGARSVAAAARDFGVSRKTAHKWLARRDADPSAPLADRPRRPASSPGRTPAAVEARVLGLRDRHRWGPRKIHHALRRDPDPPVPLPAARTVADILRRHGRVAPPRPAPAPAPLRFERAAPNDLWQLDFKGPLEVDRRRCLPLTVLDDHSRYLLCFRPAWDATTATAFAALWDVMGDAGMPRELLCDNAFGKMGTPRPAGISWFDSRLVRLGVRPVHGRPYHPQTQGKVEALHASAERELLGFDADRSSAGAFEASCRRWREAYNALRPHEALGDEPPASRWRPSDRRRPRELPGLEYPPGSALRRVDGRGAISYRGARVLVGAGVAGDRVRVEEGPGGVLSVFYGWMRVREVSTAAPGGGSVL
jgi:transposase InsO family protein